MQDFDGLQFLSGDHHIHTHYSPDGKYSVQRQVAEAHQHGLRWMVITDHGGPTHNRIGVDLTYPDILRARSAFQDMLVFLGLEWFIPGAEHGTIILEQNAHEKEQIKTFEAAFDGSIGPNTEQQALAALRWLDALTPKPVFFANHPARRGFDSPRQIRAWNAVAPAVARGFEGAPGHQAFGLVRDADGRIVGYRGAYGNSPGPGSHEVFPVESYYTYGGFDWMTAKLGGVWDSLLGDGIRWWITANSDVHNYWNDLQDVDRAGFGSGGFVTEADRYLPRLVYTDFRPGEYSRTYVVTRDASYAGVMAALRAGQMFVVHGDLIDRLTFDAVAEARAQRTTGLGGTLRVEHNASIRLEISLRVPSVPNSNNQRPVLDHVDLIEGAIGHPSATAGPDALTNPTTRVVRTWSPRDFHAREEADGLVLSTVLHLGPLQRSVYLRLRGTNTSDTSRTPPADPDMRGTTGPAVSPWDDLWFYSNPIFIELAE